MKPIPLKLFFRRNIILFCAVIFSTFSASALGVECLPLLHSNVTAINFDFKKLFGTTSEEVDSSIKFFSSGDTDDGFYATNGRSLIYVDSNTKKVRTIIAPKNTNYLSTDESINGIIYGEFQVAKKSNTPEETNVVGKSTPTEEGTVGAQEGGGSDAPRVENAPPSRIFFFNKKSKKLIVTRPIPLNNIRDYTWDKANTQFFPFLEKDQLKVLDTNTGEIKDFELPFVPNSVRAIGESNHALLMGSGTSPMFIDMTTGKVANIEGLERFKTGDPNTPTGTYVVRTKGNLVQFRNGMDNPSSKTPSLLEFDVDLNTKKIRNIKKKKDDYYFQIAYANGELEIHYDRNFFYTEEPPIDPVDPIRKSIGGAEPPSNTNGVQSLLRDGTTGKELLPRSSNFNIIDGDGQSLIRTNRIMDGKYKDELFIYEHSTKKIKPLPLSGKGGIINSDISGAIDSMTYDAPRGWWILNYTQYNGGTWSNELLIYGRDGSLIDHFGIADTGIVSDSRARFMGLSSLNRGGEGNPATIGFTQLTPLDVNTKPRDPREGWRKGVGRFGRLLPESEAKSAYPELLAYFKKKIYLRAPGTASAAFLNVFSVSNLEAGRILSAHPDLIEIIKKNPLSIDKKSMHAFGEKLRAKDNYIQSLLAGAGFLSAKSVYFEALRPLLERTPKSKIEDTVDTLAEGFKNSLMAEEASLSDVFMSLVYKMVRHSFSENFGLKEGPLTTMTYTQKAAANGASEINLLTLGSGKITGGKETRFGMNYRDVEKVSIDPNVGPNQVLLDKKYAWEHEGERYTAKVKVTTANRTIADIVRFTDGPEYDKLLKNKKLTTAVVTGSNLLHYAADTMGEYLQAFRDRGYKFDKDVELSDLYGFLKEKIETGDIDLLVKEAHSDGDEKNLFRIFKTSRLKVGRKKLKNGEEEVAYLIYPSANATEDASDATTRLIPNEEFGGMVRKREETGIPLYYLNGSCWSHTKANAEIQTASSWALVEIPSLTTMDTFVNEKTGIMHATVFSILDRKTYNEIEAAGQKNLEAKSGESNVLLFPSTDDKDQYMKQVLANFKMPVTVKIEVYDSKGNLYNIDQQ